jgi:hypothetical protein
MRRSIGRSLIGLAFAGAVVVGPGAVSASAAACQSWGVQPPNVGSDDNSLRGVGLTSGCVAWAVGYSTDTGAHRALVERWNGTAWKLQTAPNVGAATELADVAATSPSRAWAVGWVQSSIQQTFVIRWNGKAWSQQTSPNPGTLNNELDGVAAVSGTNVWAVGRQASSGAFRTLIEHWNGSAWKVVPSPNVGAGNNELEGIAVVSAKNVWAVGDYFDLDASLSRTLVLHWNGSSWKRVKSPNVGAVPNELRAVTAVSATNVWAVGGRGFTDRTLTLHWNGTRWKVVKSPNVGTMQNGLWGVTATSGSNVWAVGHFQDQATQIRFLVLHWNGSAWKVEARGPTGMESNFWAVDATSPTNAWSVGDAQLSPSRTYAVHCC